MDKITQQKTKSTTEVNPNNKTPISIVFFVIAVLCFLFLPLVKVRHRINVPGICIFAIFIGPGYDLKLLTMGIMPYLFLILATIFLRLKLTSLYKVMLSGILVWLSGLFWLLWLFNSQVSFGLFCALFFFALARLTVYQKSKAEIVCEKREINKHTIFLFEIEKIRVPGTKNSSTWH